MNEDLIAHGLEAIAAITSAMLAHSSGALTPQQAAAEMMKIHADSLAHIDPLHVQLAAIDKEEDKALHDRFDVITKPEIKAP